MKKGLFLPLNATKPLKRYSCEWEFILFHCVQGMANREQQTTNYIPVCRAVAKSLANSALRELVITVSVQRYNLFVRHWKLHAGTNVGGFRRFPPVKGGIGQKQKSENFEYLCSVFSWVIWGFVAILLTHKQVEYVSPEGAMDLIVNAVNIPTLETLDIKFGTQAGNVSWSGWQQSLGKALKENQTLKSLRLVCDFCLLSSTLHVHWSMDR